MVGLLGKKLGQTRVYASDGSALHVTVVESVVPITLFSARHPKAMDTVRFNWLLIHKRTSG